MDFRQYIFSRPPFCNHDIHEANVHSAKKTLKMTSIPFNLLAWYVREKYSAETHLEVLGVSGSVGISLSKSSCKYNDE